MAGSAGSAGSAGTAGWRGTAGATAAAAAVVFAGSLLAVDVGAPERATAEAVRQLVVEQRTPIALSAVAGTLSAVALLVLAAGLRLLAVRKAARGDVAADVAALAGVLVAVEGLLWSAVQLVGVVADVAAASDAEVLAWWSLRGLSEALGDLGTLPRGLFLLAASTAALRHAVLPRWLCWFGLVIGAAAALSPVGLVTGWAPFGVLFMSGLFGFLLWPLLVAVSLGLRAGRAGGRRMERATGIEPA